MIIHNYDMKEFKLPNETFFQKMVLVIKDLDKAKSNLSNFIYENN